MANLIVTRGLSAPAPTAPPPPVPAWLPMLSGIRRRRPPPAPAAASSLLAALVAHLQAEAPVSALLATPASIYLDLSNWGDEVPFLLLEGYDEVLPGETTEDEPVEVSVCLYGRDLDEVRSLVTATKNALDSPAINQDSTRTVQFTWAVGSLACSTTGVMRDRARFNRVPSLGRNGELIYDARIDYQFWTTPNE